MNVISLFNGMGTLRQALSNLNIKVDNQLFGFFKTKK